MNNLGFTEIDVDAVHNWIDVSFFVKLQLTTKIDVEIFDLKL